MNATLRTAEQEQRYQDDIKAGLTKKLSDIRGEDVDGIKTLPNRYEYDMIAMNGVIYVDTRDNPKQFMYNWVDRYLAGEFKEDYFHLNNLHLKSQPDTEHILGQDFNEERIEFMRLCFTHRKKIEFWLKDMGVEV